MKFLITLFVLFSNLTMAASLYDLKMKGAKDEEINFKDYEGKVLMIVNIATRCGFSGQLDDLEKLYQKYKDKNFMIIGIPSNNFLSQTPEDNKEVANICRLKYGVSFPITEKVEVIGDKKAELIQWIHSQKGFDGRIMWNFEKFIIDKKGNVVERFRSMTNPMDADVQKAIERNLN